MYAHAVARLPLCDMPSGLVAFLIHKSRGQRPYVRQKLNESLSRVLIPQLCTLLHRGQLLVPRWTAALVRCDSLEALVVNLGVGAPGVQGLVGVDGAVLVQVDGAGAAGPAGLAIGVVAEAAAVAQLDAVEGGAEVCGWCRCGQAGARAALRLGQGWARRGRSASKRATSVPAVPETLPYAPQHLCA